MKGNGNNLSTLIEKLFFMCIPSSGARTKYIYKHKDRFKNVGDRLFFQPRQFPTDPEYISLGNNVNIASGVDFINHDVIYRMLNIMFETNEFNEVYGCIEIGNNVMIGANSIILPNVKIGSNVIIGAGAVVTKDIPDNCVAGGIPCKVLGSIEDYIIKRKIGNNNYCVEERWAEFYISRMAQR